MTILTIIYFIGVAFLSIPGLYVFLLNAAFAGDSSSYDWGGVGKAFVLVFFLIWFWPIAVPFFEITRRKSEKRSKKANAAYQARLEAGPNYGKLMVLRGVSEYVAQFEGTEVTVVEWSVNDGKNRRVQPVTTWPGGSNHVMSWSVESLEEI